jgi:hypothetical protein
MDSNLGVAFLGLIAAALVVQTVYLIVLGRAGQKAVARLARLEQAYERDVQPTLQSLRSLTENADVLSRRVVEGMPEIETAARDAAESVRRAGEAVHALEELVLTPLRPLAQGMAIFRGLRRGWQTYRSLPGLTAGRRA